jgi:hypothetical protein
MQANMQRCKLQERQMTTEEDTLVVAAVAANLSAFLGYNYLTSFSDNYGYLNIFLRKRKDKKLDSPFLANI